MNRSEFSTHAGKLGITIDASTYEAFFQYDEMLRAWSGRVRLISHGDRAHVWDRHFLDSLTGSEALVDGPTIDLGSGGGFPGLPLALIRPDLHFTLVESARMKCLFLRHVVSELGIQNVEILHERAEHLSGGTFDLVLARAVGSLEALWDLAKPLLSPGSGLLAYKGPDEPRAVSDPRAVVSVRLVRNPANGRDRALVSIR
jgi:16S rRNA (guanine527-N7)-methyltransferase